MARTGNARWLSAWHRGLLTPKETLGCSPCTAGAGRSPTWLPANVRACPLAPGRTTAVRGPAAAASCTGAVAIAGPPDEPGVLATRRARQPQSLMPCDLDPPQPCG